MSKIKCLIIDDDNEAIKRLKELLLKLEDIEIVGLSTNPSFIVNEIVSVEPDIVFLAIEMHGKDGFEIIDGVRGMNYFPVFIMTSPHIQYAVRAVKYAVFDYLLKPIDFNELKNSINRYKSFNPDNSAININSCRICNCLSNREKEVLSYIIKGHTSHEISEKLFISVSTINFHRQNILLKTSSKNFAELSYKISEVENLPIQYKLN